MQLYDQVYIYINGKLLAENTSVSTNLEGEQQEVSTTVKGFAGISAGPDKRVVSLENVVPVKGMEFAIEEAYLNKAELEVRLQFGGARWQGDLAASLGRLVAGEVLVGGQRLRHWPLRRAFDALLQAELDFGRGTLLTITAASMVCSLGDIRFTESLAC